MYASNELLERSTPEEHLLQFYSQQDDQRLVENVGHYLIYGWNAGDGLLVIASEKRNEAIVRRLEELGANPEPAIRDGRFVLAEAQHMLGRFMIENQPDWGLFQTTIGRVARDAKEHAASGVLRAYGEMAAVLWEAGRYSAAIRSEHYWNELRDMTSFKLFCAYPIDILSGSFQSAAVDALLSTHTHLLPTATIDSLEYALNRAMAEVLGPQVDSIRALIDAQQRPRWPELSSSEASILWLQRNLPEYAGEIVERARRYRSSAAAAP